MSERLSGDVFRGRIEDLARGEQSHAELAEKWGVSLQAVREFSSYHSAKVAARKAELQGELNADTDGWLATAVEAITQYRELFDGLNVHLKNPDLDLRIRHRFTRDATAIVHKVAEIRGFPAARTRIELDVGGMELPAFGTKWVPVTDGSSTDT